MTKGHFHTILDTSEIYYGLSGHGMMLMETPEGQVDWKDDRPRRGPLRPRTLGPPQHQHRHRASGDVLRLPGDAGHDYGTIEEKGYRKLVVERDGRPAVIDNPKWKV